VITVKFFKQRIIVKLQLYGIIIIGVNPLHDKISLVATRFYRELFVIVAYGLPFFFLVWSEITLVLLSAYWLLVVTYFQIEIISSLKEASYLWPVFGIVKTEWFYSDVCAHLEGSNTKEYLCTVTFWSEENTSKARI
jgi:hypothetical protein